MTRIQKQEIRNLLGILELKLENKNLRRENADLREQNAELKADLRALRDFEKAKLEVAKKFLAWEVL